MSSFSMLEKVRYTGTPSDVVALKEYIVFVNEQTDTKYIVCKFVNNLNQRLYGMRFEISQYDESDALLEKNTLSYDKFSARGGERFVPSAKLAVNPRCKNISYKLLYAAFDKVQWENGSFSDNDYQFERYVHDEKKLARNDEKPKQVSKKDEKQNRKEEKKQKEKDELNSKTPFTVRDETRKNRSGLPTAYRVLSVLIVLALVCVTAVLFRRASDRFTVGDYDLIRYSDDTAGIYGYDGDAKELVIPAKIGDYTITRIETNAFKGAKITAVGFESETLTIDRNAFVDCRKLETVAAAGKVIVTAYAFNGCSNVTQIFMPHGTVNANGFYRSGSVKKTTYYFDKMLTNSAEEIFGETNIKDLLD
ncbi:MAG: leucine-rich repeat domain-containing protein [Clostridiales bacterium]|nr:leucine-rich repeat domain-containing protein [Clostridiales bacterium]